MGGGGARVSDFFFQKNPSLNLFFFFLFEGVKVREDWLEYVNLFYKGGGGGGGVKEGAR